MPCIFRRKKKCAGLEDSSEVCQGENNFSNGEDTHEHNEDYEEDEQSPFLQPCPPPNNPYMNSHEKFDNISSSHASINGP